jgi:hypothetical protein
VRNLGTMAKNTVAKNNNNNNSGSHIVVKNTVAKIQWLRIQ